MAHSISAERQTELLDHKLEEVPQPGGFRGPVAYIMSRFPLLTETFILREMLELESEGIALAIFPLLRANPTVRHAEVQGLRAPVDHTPFLSPSILAANARIFKRAPGRYLRLLATVIRHNLKDRSLLAGAIGIFPKSVYYAEQVERLGIRHVHAHFATHPALAGLIVSELTGVGFSFTAHAHDIFVHKAMLAEKVRKATFVAAISDYNRQLLLGLAPDVAPDRIEVVRCGIQVENYGREPVGADASGPMAVCVASLQPYKGLKHLVRAAALVLQEVPDFRCRIIGEGAQREELERLIAELGLGDKVELTGGLPQHEVTKLLGCADLFVLPSVVAASGQMEGIPVALMEAMASRLPVISTRISGIPELIEDERSGLLVEPESEKALAEAIVRLCKQPQLRQKLGVAGREKVAASFELKPNVARLRKRFARAAATPGGVPAALIDCAALHLGAAGINELRITPIRAGANSQVFAVDRAGHDHEPGLILKLHRLARVISTDSARDATPYAANEHKALTFLSEAFTACSGHSSVPQPIDFIPQEAALLMTRIPGQTLSAMLRFARLRPGLSGRLPAIFGQAGAWLADFQAITLSSGDPAAHLERVRREFEADLAACGVAGLSPDLVTAAGRQVGKALREVDPATLQLTGRHCDFAPYNLIIGGDRLTVIDFEGLQDGLATDDLCWFLAMVEAIPSWHLSPHARSRLHASFRHGFEQRSVTPLGDIRPFLIAASAKVMASSPLLRLRHAGVDGLKQRHRLHFYERWFGERLA